MDITSFSLGVLFVVVVGMLTVTVYNLLRVYKIKKELQGLHESFNSNIKHLFNQIDETKSYVTSTRMAIEKHYDSRIDKLIDRIAPIEHQHRGKSYVQSSDVEKLEFLRTLNNDDINRIKSIQKQLSEN